MPCGCESLAQATLREAAIIQSHATRFIRSAATAFVLSGCAGVQQYSDDPAYASGAFSGYADYIATYKTYFDAHSIDRYEAATGPQRTVERDTLVINRMLAYDATYGSFKRTLLTEGNSLNTGGDLLTLALNGLGATTGGVAAKAAFAAAAAGITGAKATISSDLFYQRTLPALVAQMDANRALAKTTILDGLAKSDSEYPLVRALVDLQRLSDAGSLTSAVSSITESASIQKSAAENTLTFTRSATFAAALETKDTIVQAIKPLTDPQLLAVARNVDPLMAADAKGSAVADSLDPNHDRLRSAPLARIVLVAWIRESDADPAMLAKWSAAISAARAGP